ncbi:hypothetical protein AS188_04585 [Kocuria flava]|uniref:CPBP family intramembrane metalloprotease n=1 Tax=Kocuria flava TaxID=446860 RepID=A0A0U3GGB6_9MICC|nr:hypothetical protein [Kocuria flava]ALU39150.1 hypothetical protein AS188_04585 [Kocuria flava]GEO90912.1 hypothetical protein KFL01_02180 [Kocuria flava]
MSDAQQLPDGQASRTAALGWFAAGTVLVFLAPWAGTDLLALDRDLYHLLQFTVLLAFLAAFLARTGAPWGRWLRRRAGWSLAVGALVSVVAVLNVLRNPPTPRPGGLELVVDVLWRGLVYGTVDAAVLYVFPALVALLLLRGRTAGAGRHLAFAGLTLLLAVVVVGAYHLGYPQYQGPALLLPLAGAVQFSVPALVTANPVGAVLAHVSTHVAAVLHENEGTTYLPPAGTEGRLLDGPGGAVVVVLWLSAAAGAWWWGRLLSRRSGARPAGPRRPRRSRS